MATRKKHSRRKLEKRNAALTRRVEELFLHLQLTEDYVVKHCLFGADERHTPPSAGSESAKPRPITNDEVRNGLS